MRREMAQLQLFNKLSHLLIVMKPRILCDSRRTQRENIIVHLIEIITDEVIDL